MAKLSAHGTELYRYLSPKTGALISVRSDGVILRKRIFGTWRRYSHKNPSLTLEEWKELKREHYEALPAWCRGVRGFPSQAELERWQMDGACDVVDGSAAYEPDYRGTPGNDVNAVCQDSHGPSWLVALHLI
jgi:hypothetical protein